MVKPEMFPYEYGQRMNCAFAVHYSRLLAGGQQKIWFGVTSVGGTETRDPKVLKQDWTAGIA
jgi:hypothetical protein